MFTHLRKKLNWRNPVYHKTYKIVDGNRFWNRIDSSCDGFIITENLIAFLTEEVGQLCKNKANPSFKAVIFKGRSQEEIVLACPLTHSRWMYVTLVLWAITSCGLLVDTSISEKITVSILNPEDVKTCCLHL